MTVSTEYVPDRYTANGSNDTFPITFSYGSSANVLVTVYDTNNVPTVQVIDTDYTIVSDDVVFTVAPTLNYIVVIELDVAQTQLADYVNNAQFPNETTEANLDKLTRICQQQQGQIDRALKSANYSDTVYEDLPILAEDEFFIGTATPGVLTAGSIVAGTGISISVVDGVITISAV